MQGNQGQQEEFLRAYDAHADAIFRHCYYRVYDRERARELMQECFMRAWQYAADGKQIDNLKAFLYRVANNLVIDESRRKKSSSLDALVEERGDEPLDLPQVRDDGMAPERNAEAGIMLQNLEKLESKYRDVIRMRFIDDLTPREIAAIVGESENVVSVRIHRGIKQLREFL